jgi:hypothetical protein
MVYLSIQMCKHKNCQNQNIIGSSFCHIHNCKYYGCIKHRVGFESYPAKIDEYGIYVKKFSQMVEFCSMHRCNYIF